MSKEKGSDKKKYEYESHTFYYENKQYKAYGKTKAEAIKKAALMEAALERGEAGISGKMSVKRWADEWMDTYKKGTVTDKSYANYERHVKLLTDAIGNMKIKDVRDVHLQKILNARAGKSKSDMEKLRNTIQAIFKRARISRLIPFDPAEELEMPRVTEHKRRSITDRERKWILEMAEKHHAGLWIKMMLYCGLRPGEIMALQWKDINFKKKVVKITKAKESGKNDIKDTKTEAGEREIPIPDVLLKDLKAARRDVLQKNDKSKVVDLSPPVFTQKTNDRPHTEASFYKAWNNFLRESDIALGATVYRSQIKESIIEVESPDLEPYCLRHTYCTDLEAAGVPINVAKYLMGHSDITVTANIYTHTSEKTIKAAATKINTAICKDNKKKNNDKRSNKSKKHA